jgi:hypothetical protein
MATPTLMPSPRQRFVDEIGLPLAYGMVFTFAAGTSDKLAAFQDPQGLIPHKNPIRLDNQGEALIYWLGNYKVDVRSYLGIQLPGYPVDNFNAPDADGAFLTVSTALAKPSGSASVGFLQDGAGAVATTLQAKGRQQFSITDFMTSAQSTDAGTTNPVLDLTQALKNAHDALPARGGEIWIPPGIFNITSVTFTKPVTLRGYSLSASVIRTTSATADVLTMAAFGCSVRDMTIDSTVTRTAGAHIFMSGAWYSSITDVRFSKYYIGVDINNTVGLNIRNISGIDGTSSSISPDGGLVRVGETMYNGNINIDGVVADVNDPKKQPSYGILLRFVDVCTVKNALFIHHGTNVKIAPHKDQFVAQTFFHGNSFDTAVTGVEIAPEAGGSVLRCGFDSSWFGQNSGDGLRINGTLGIVDGISFNGDQFIGNGGIGVNIYGSKAKNISFGAACRSASNGGNGLQITAAASNIVWDGGALGVTDNANGNVSYGFAVEAGCSGAVRNTNLEGNGLGRSSNNSLTTFLESGNTPHEWLPFGTVVSSTAGTISAAASMRYKRFAKTVHFSVTINVTANSGSGAVQATLPFPCGPGIYTFAGRESAVTGKQVQGVVGGGDSKVNVYFYDNTYPGAVGNSINVTGTYEAA